MGADKNVQGMLVMVSGDVFNVHTSTRGKWKEVNGMGKREHGRSEKHNTRKVIPKIASPIVQPSSHFSLVFPSTFHKLFLSLA